MQDTYNLAWKLCLVVRGLYPRPILSTYQTERQAVDLDMIAMDPKISKFYAVINLRRADFQALTDQFSNFICGVRIKYTANSLIASSYDKSSIIVARKPTDLRARIPSFSLINHAFTEQTYLHTLLPTIGTFLYLLFAADLSYPRRLQISNELAPWLEALMGRYKNPAQLREWLVVIEVLLIHTTSREGLELLDLHEVFHPCNERWGWYCGECSRLLMSSLRRGKRKCPMERLERIGLMG